MLSRPTGIHGRPPNVARQALVHLRQEYWEGAAISPSPGTFPNQGSNLCLPGLTGKFYTLPQCQPLDPAQRALHCLPSHLVVREQTPSLKHTEASLAVQMAAVLTLRAGISPIRSQSLRNLLSALETGSDTVARGAIAVPRANATALPGNTTLTL